MSLIKIENCSIQRNRCQDLMVFVFITTTNKFLRFDGVCFVITGQFISFLFELAVIGDCVYYWNREAVIQSCGVIIDLSKLIGK